MLEKVMLEILKDKLHISILRINSQRKLKMGKLFTLKLLLKKIK
jgi:hypothetical protein